MTKKETLDRIESIITKHEVDDENVTITDEQDYEALKLAIKFLRICNDWIPIMHPDGEKHIFHAHVSRDGMPDDDEEVLISINEMVTTDVFHRDGFFGCYFDRYDYDEIDAWMPLPKSYDES